MKPIKEKLESIKANEDNSLYQHLTNLFTKYLLENPK